MMVVSFKAEAARRSHETPSKKDTDAAVGRERRVTVWLENIQPKGHAGEEEEEDKGEEEEEVNEVEGRMVGWGLGEWGYRAGPDDGSAF